MQLLLLTSLLLTLRLGNVFAKYLSTSREAHKNTFTTLHTWHRVNWSSKTRAVMSTKLWLGVAT